MMVLNSDSPTPGPDVWWTVEEKMKRDVRHEPGTFEEFGFDFRVVYWWASEGETTASDEPTRKEGGKDGWMERSPRQIHTLTRMHDNRRFTHPHRDTHADARANNTHNKPFVASTWTMHKNYM